MKTDFDGQIGLRTRGRCARLLDRSKGRGQRRENGSASLSLQILERGRDQWRHPWWRYAAITAERKCDSFCRMCRNSATRGKPARRTSFPVTSRHFLFFVLRVRVAKERKNGAEKARFDVQCRFALQAGTCIRPVPLVFLGARGSLKYGLFLACTQVAALRYVLRIRKHGVTRRRRYLQCSYWFSLAKVQTL